MREKWVDYTKVVACLLVLTGHFFQSMVEAGIMNKSIGYQWYIQTIYLFHVPLFLFCSGYLYQKTANVRSFTEWKRNVRKKAIALGVPYFVFLSLSWVAKVAFSSNVNTEVGGGYLYTLFIHPIGAYWYLYFLFFMFVITPTLVEDHSKKGQISRGVILLCALVFKVLAISGIVHSYFLYTLFSNEIWFVGGMYVFIHRKYFMQKINYKISWLLISMFVAGSVVIDIFDIKNSWIDFVIGTLAVLSIVALIYLVEDKVQDSRMLAVLSGYTFPIYLMHTLAAAPVRIILLKMGIENVVMHGVFGLLASVILPIIAAMIMKKISILEAMLYPMKFLNKKGHVN